MPMGMAPITSERPHPMPADRTARRGSNRQPSEVGNLYFLRKFALMQADLFIVQPVMPATA